MIYTFTIPIKPVPQPRPRAHTIAGHASMYEADRKHPIHAFKDFAKAWVMRNFHEFPLTGPLAASMLFVLPKPITSYRATTPMPREPHFGKTIDVDNLQKSILDAMTGILWEDDGQVWWVSAAKIVGAGHEAPHVKLAVWPAGNGSNEFGSHCPGIDLFGTLRTTATRLDGSPLPGVFSGIDDPSNPNQENSDDAEH